MPRKYGGNRILSPATRARLRTSDKERATGRSMPLVDRDASSGRFHAARKAIEGGRSRSLKPRR